MSTKPEFVIEIFLQPGEVYFGDAGTRIRTLLGSCVSITLWHPRQRVGGMCHYMLPNRPVRHANSLDGRYAEEAVELLLREIAKVDTRPSEYEVKMFGGGNMFQQCIESGAKKIARVWKGDGMGVAQRNIEIGRALLARHGFHVKTENVGGNDRRHLIFDVWSGHVWMRHGAAEQEAPVAEARKKRH